MVISQYPTYSGLSLSLSNCTIKVYAIPPYFGHQVYNERKIKTSMTSHWLPRLSLEDISGVYFL